VRRIAVILTIVCVDCHAGWEVVVGSGSPDVCPLCRSIEGIEVRALRRAVALSGAEITEL
jgi:hypothetical protein